MKPTPSNEQKSTDRNLRTWRNLLSLSIFSAYFYAFIEWLFFVTKPSSLSILAPLDASLVLVVTGGAFALLLLAILLLITLPARFIRNENWRKRLLAIGHIVPALMLTITALIMLDNFTYTVSNFGIVSTMGVWRALYTWGFGIGLWQAFRFVHRTVRKRRKKYASFLALGLLTVSTVALLASRISPQASLADLNPNNSVLSAGRPNILILGSDGLSASYLSAYGYDEKTTPFLEQMLDGSLVAENAFPNASSTTGSTTSALTGKEPAVTKVFLYPDALSGQDTLEHLPGILKQYGYKTVEIGTSYYVDALKLNLTSGFDIVNKRSINLHYQGAFRTILGNTPSAYFIGEILERVRQRLLHIFWIEEMQNPMKEVNDPRVGMTDEQRVDQIIELLDQTDDHPVFIFAHFMSTHGPHFDSNKQVFAIGSSEDAEWDKARYKDAILTFDSYLERIYTHLEQTGQLDNTILVIYTDHGYLYTINQRIPVIFHFPDHEYAGRVKNNVQIIDIPVTLMDYLGIPSPSWMTGESLLNHEPPADREIISIRGSSPKKVAPPFFQIKIVQFIICHKFYLLNVQENKWNSGELTGHTAKCEDNQVPPDKEVRQRILDYLESFDYDISSLNTKVQGVKDP